MGLDVAGAPVDGPAACAAAPSSTSARNSPMASSPCCVELEAVPRCDDPCVFDGDGTVVVASIGGAGDGIGATHSL